jgi:hypothetical protein
MFTQLKKSFAEALSRDIGVAIANAIRLIYSQPSINMKVGEITEYKIIPSTLKPTCNQS